MMLQHGLSEDSSYTVNQSLRFRASNSANLSRTYTSNATWTFSAWIKRGALGVISPLFGDAIKFNANDTLTAMGLTTTAVFRDPSAWYHIHVSNGGLYINGVSFGAVTTSAQTNTKIGTNNTNYFDGYIAHPYFIDSTSSSYTNFGQTDGATGIWVPKPFSGAYGTTGGFWPFNDATSLTTLGYDRSGNGNNWTCNGISVTAGVTYDVMKDSPTNGAGEVGNYATLNPLDKQAAVALSNANLRTTMNSNQGSRSTIVVSSGKWYVEGVADTAILNSVGFGFCRPSDPVFFAVNATGYCYYSSGEKVNNNSTVAYGASWALGDIIGMALDLDAGQVTWYKNGVSQGVAYTGLSGEYIIGIFCNGSGSTNFAFNFGQRPFAYTPPTGFKALHTGNLPQPAIKKASEHFDVKLNTGANIKSTCEGLYTYFLEWIKGRANSNSHQLIDTVRGTSAVLQSHTTAAETTYTTPSGSSVGWVWNAGGAAVTNNAGSITSQVSANVAAGFSVVSAVTPDGAVASYGHGLGLSPSMVIIKGRAGSASWHVYHKDMGIAYRMTLEATTGRISTSYFSAFTSTLLQFNTALVNGLAGFVAYCFAEIPGYSKAFSINGNASADGTFCYLGFAPKFILIKCSSTTGNWYIFDTVRNTYNVLGEQLYPNLTNAGSTITSLDAVSNGFKMRLAGDPNAAQTYIGFAIAESPFALNNRAR